MTEQGQGVVQSVENKIGQSGKAYYVIDIGGVRLSSFEPDIHKAVNQMVNYTYTTKEQGGRVYKNLQSFDVLPASQQPQQASYSQVPQGQNNEPTITTAGAVPAGNLVTSTFNPPDNRQESIVRQSTMKMAIEVAGDMAVSGISIIPEEEKKTSKAKKDPELYIEYVKQLAIRFKDFIQNGSWDNAWAEVDNNDKNYVATTGGELPF